MASKIIIFTDLDGTLLDHGTYSYEAAKPALARAKETKTPIVSVTSKTRAENEFILKEMGLWQSAPFIVESGGAIYIPKNYFERSEKKGSADRKEAGSYFSFDIKNELPNEKIIEDNKFIKIELGKPFQEVRKILKESAAAAGLEVRGTGSDMSPEEFRHEVDFQTIEKAHRAQEREYQEGFKILNVPEDQMKDAQAKIKAEIEKRGYFMSIGGRFCQIMGSKSKIRSVEILTGLFKKEFGDIHTIGLGDAQADIEFCQHCDEGYIVKNPKKAVGAEAESGKIHLVDEVGPKGFNKVILRALQN